MIQFRNNTEKSLEVILWMANRRPGIDFHAILKLLFFADVEHLNEYGRPIVGGRYNALEYGPASKPTHDILDRDPMILEALGIDGELPFDVRFRYRVYPKREPNMRKLSRSDIQALEKAWDEYSHLDFDGLTEVSHRHPAYKSAEDEGRFRMRYEDFLEGANRDPAVVADLQATARRVRI